MNSFKEGDLVWLSFNADSKHLAIVVKKILHVQEEATYKCFSLTFQRMFKSYVYHSELKPFK